MSEWCPEDHRQKRTALISALVIGTSLTVACGSLGDSKLLADAKQEFAKQTKTAPTFSDVRVSETRQIVCGFATSETGFPTLPSVMINEIQWTYDSRLFLPGDAMFDHEWTKCINGAILNKDTPPLTAKQVAEAEANAARGRQQTNALIKYGEALEKEQAIKEKLMENPMWREPYRALELKNLKWYKGGFETVQMASFSVVNSAPFAIKDFEVTCTYAGPSGTEIDRNTQVVYETVPAKGTKNIRQFSMGFIRTQVATSSCQVSGGGVPL